MAINIGELLRQYKDSRESGKWDTLQGKPQYAGMMTGLEHAFQRGLVERDPASNTFQLAAGADENAMLFDPVSPQNVVQWDGGSRQPMDSGGALFGPPQQAAGLGRSGRPMLSQSANGGIARIAIPTAANVAGGLISYNAADSARDRLTGGIDRAQGMIGDAAGRARTEIVGGADRARNTLGDLWQRQQDTLRPYREAGEPALAGLRDATAAGGEFNRPFTMQDYELYKDPGFDLRLQRGAKAIEAEANAYRNRFSGATLKRISDYNQESQALETQAAYNRRQGDIQGRFGRLMDVAGIGERAAGREVDAGGTYGRTLADLEGGTGRTLADLEVGTAKALADLQTDLASAQAAGDVAKANAITDTINNILETMGGLGVFDRLLGKGGQQIAGGGPAGDILGSIGEPVGKALDKIGEWGKDAGKAIGIGLGTAGKTIGQAAAKFFPWLASNPITWAAAGALGVGILWHKSQARHEANEWVQQFQNPFDQQMDAINQGINSGEFTSEQGVDLRRAVVSDYIAANLKFRQLGSDHALAAKQGMQKFIEMYVQRNELGFNPGV